MTFCYPNDNVKVDSDALFYLHTKWAYDWKRQTNEREMMALLNLLVKNGVDLHRRHVETKQTPLEYFLQICKDFIGYGRAQDYFLVINFILQDLEKQKTEIKMECLNDYVFKSVFECMDWKLFENYVHLFESNGISLSTKYMAHCMNKILSDWLRPNNRNPNKKKLYFGAPFFDSDRIRIFDFLLSKGCKFETKFIPAVKHTFKYIKETIQKRGKDDKWDVSKYCDKILAQTV